MFDGDLFTQGENKKLFIYSQNKQSREDLSLNHILFEKCLDENLADFSISNEGLLLVNSLSEGLKIESLSSTSLISIAAVNREIFFNNQLSLTKERVLSHETNWKFLKSILENLKEESERIDFINKVIRDLDLKKSFDFKLISKDELSESQKQDGLVIEIENYFLVINADEEDKLEFVHNLSFVLDNFEILKLSSIEVTNLKIAEIFNLIPYPMVMLNGEVVVSHNNLFSKLNLLPRAFKDSEKSIVEHEGEKFKVLKIEVDKYQTLFILLKQDELGVKISEGKSELGIIAGSIAHELNNPVAGILAAISLLELEDWDNENSKVLEEMKDSSKRCKDLIETFLGFSKFRKFGHQYKELGVVLDQATSLIRYRIVESGVTINLSISDELSKEMVKSSVLPMVFYLLLNDLMTLLSHKLLIDSSLEKIVNLELTTGREGLEIRCKGFSFSTSDKKIFDKKLIYHLLEMENMTLDYQDSTIYINGLFHVS